MPASVSLLMDLLDTLVRFFTENGYLAVFVVLMICGFGVPIPEDITLVAGGVIAGLGYVNVHVMCAVGLVGVLTGDSLMFIVGRVFGTRALRLRWVAYLLTPRRYARVQAKFDRFGNRMLFFARFLPGLRTAPPRLLLASGTLSAPAAGAFFVATQTVQGERGGRICVREFAQDQCRPASDALDPGSRPGSRTWRPHGWGSRGAAAGFRRPT